MQQLYALLVIIFNFPVFFVLSSLILMQCTRINKKCKTIKSSAVSSPENQKNKTRSSNTTDLTSVMTTSASLSCRRNSRAKKQKKDSVHSLKNIYPASDSHYTTSQTPTSKSSSHNTSYSSSSLTKDIVAHFESAAQKRELGIADQVRQEVILKRLPLEDRARIKRIFEKKKKMKKSCKKKAIPTEKFDMKELDSDEEFYEKSLKLMDVSSKGSKRSVGEIKQLVVY